MLQLPLKTIAPRATSRAADPILHTIAEHQRCVEAFNTAYDRLEEKESSQWHLHGRCPDRLIAWRRYSAIGGTEIAGARDRFLQEEGADPKRIQAEYKDAMKRYRATAREVTAWYKRTGLAPLRRERDDARQRLAVLRDTLATATAETSAGAAALLQCLFDDYLFTESGWHLQALKTLANSLAQMGER